MKNEKPEMGYVESTMEHVSRTNHRRGIHIWLDETEDGEGISVSMNHNFNDDEGNEEFEYVIQVLEDVLKSVKIRAMGSENPELMRFMEMLKMLESEGGKDE